MVRRSKSGWKLSILSKQSIVFQYCKNSQLLRSIPLSKNLLDVIGVLECEYCILTSPELPTMEGRRTKPRALPICQLEADQGRMS